MVNSTVIGTPVVPRGDCLRVHAPAASMASCVAAESRLRRILLSLTLIVLHAVTGTTSAAEAGDPSGATTRSGSAEVEAVYESMQRFLTDRAKSMGAVRAEHWRSRNFDSAEALEASVRPQRARLRALLGVPEQCAGDGRVRERTRIPAPEPLVLERVRILACGGRLQQSGLLGYRAGLKGSAPLVIVLHGTAASPERAFGLDDPRAYQTREYHHRVAARLAEAGYLVYAPQLVTERRDDPQTGFNRLRNEIDMRAAGAGYRLLGMELGQLMAVPGALRGAGMSAPGVLGVYGISLGGMIAYYLAALDTRVSAVVVSQWLEDRNRKLMGEPEDDPLWRHPAAGHAVLPGLLRYFDDAAVASLIAPRALFVEIGREDPRARSTPGVYQEISALYRRIGRPATAVCLEVAPGGHEVVLNGALLFLDRWLRNARDPKLREFCR